MAFAKEDKFGMAQLDDGAEQTLELDPRYQYTIYHRGLDGTGINGTDNAASAKSAFISTLSGTITPDESVEDEKYELTDGANETFGPGISTLYIDSHADNTDAVLQVVRVGTPTNSY